LELAFDHLAEQTGSADVAEKLCLDILDAPFGRLEKWPDSGAIVEPLRHIGAREIYRHSYRIIYVHRNDACYVIVCVHASRDLVQSLDPIRWESLP
jgi:hypothetical protein